MQASCRSQGTPGSIEKAKRLQKHEPEEETPKSYLLPGEDTLRRIHDDSVGNLNCARLVALLEASASCEDSTFSLSTSNKLSDVNFLMRLASRQIEVSEHMLHLTEQKRRATDKSSVLSEAEDALNSQTSSPDSSSPPIDKSTCADKSNATSIVEIDWNPSIQVKRNELQKDQSYWAKRKRNNEAAKRSRDARKAKEEKTAMRCLILERENQTLRFEVARLRLEVHNIREVLITATGLNSITTFNQVK